MGRALCCFAIAGCTAGDRELVIERVDPESAMNMASVYVRVEGSGFHVPFTSDLDEGTTTIGERAASIGGVALTDVVWRDEQLVEGSVPPGLPVGPHDVTLMLGDRMGVLPGGYTVIDIASTTCSATVLDVCMLQPMPTTAITISTDDTIDTDTDPRCITLPQLTGAPVCLVYATTFAITTSGSLTATGSRPLAIASTEDLTIAGTLDVSSQRSSARPGPAADDSSCSFVRPPDDDRGGAGGASGGSFGGTGADGGTGDTNMNEGNDGDGLPGLHGPAASTTALRGGCSGQQGGNAPFYSGVGGTGGRSGGALYLYASRSVTIGGQIRATGAGGEGGSAQAGGGGGGSGGLVVIESPAIAIGGQISANGGGGGQGGRIFGSVYVGNPGADGTYGTAAAAGGTGNLEAGGDGGSGAAAANAAAAGAAHISGGGGGGGGAGTIRLLGASDVTGVVSPPPS